MGPPGVQARQLAEAMAAESLCREQAALSSILSAEAPGGAPGLAPVAEGAASGGTGPTAPAPAVVVPADRVGEAIEAVMQERHARETSELLMSQFKCVGW